MWLPNCLAMSCKALCGRSKTRPRQVHLPVRPLPGILDSGVGLEMGVLVRTARRFTLVENTCCVTQNLRATD